MVFIVVLGIISGMNQNRLLARARRADGQSVRAIAKELGAPKSSVSRWVRDVPLTDSQKAVLLLASGRSNDGSVISPVACSRASALLRRAASQERGRLAARAGDPLHRDGCMLYWAEGGKGLWAVAFVNSDAGMMVHFVKFLRTSLSVPDSYMQVSVNCYLDHGLTLAEVEGYWLSVLKLPREAMRKSTVVPTKPAGTKRHRRLKYGTCRVAVTRSEYLHHILGAIQEYTGLERPEWLGGSVRGQ